MKLQSRWLTLAIVSAALFLVVIDMTVLYTALPSLAYALQTTASEKLWILNAYSLVMAGLMPVLGALGDRIGHRRIFIFGLVVFGLASLFAAFAPNPTLLIAARGLLAVGGAAMMPATITIIRTSFQDDKELALAIGIWAAIASGGAAIGPLLGGVLLEYFWWGSVFLINVPIIAIAILATLHYVPKSAGNTDINIDLLSCLQSMIGIIALAYGIKELGKPDSSYLNACISISLGLSSLYVFAKRQLRIPKPLIDLHLLAEAPIAAGMLVALLASMTLIGFELVLSQRLQLLVGKSPLEAGIFVLPISLGSFFAGPLSGALIGRLGCTRIIATGLILMTLGILSYLYLRDANIWLQLLSLTVFGIGIGSSLTASSTLVMSNVSEDRAGMAGSVEGVAYEFGGGFGVTIFGSIMTAVYVSSMNKSEYQNIAGSSLDEAHRYALLHPEASHMLHRAMLAFDNSFSWVGFAAAGVTLGLIGVILMMRRHLRGY